MEIRPYRLADRGQCLAIFDSNTPAFFAAAEREGFEQFLNDPRCAYFVMKHEASTIGCGGYATDPERRLARLVWGMVDVRSHKVGLGRYLLLYRLREIGKAAGMEAVHLETSQLSAGFFEKQGFRVVRIVKNGFAEGIDRVEMVKRLVVCS